MKGSEYKWRKVSTSQGKYVLVEVGALISWCLYSCRIIMLLVPYMWASMTFLPKFPQLSETLKQTS